ncbi:MAG: flippase-like domain-containing protein [Candidatus Delongbacteria bacterium]|nr:flippase-like domain-containing protein [Candidatus Delongbacteria bacterium]
MRKSILNILKTILFLTVIWFLYKSISANFDKIKEINYSNYDPKYMFFSVITLFVSLVYPVFVWKYLIRSMGEKINTLSALRIWFISNLGRYIPGKVFQVAGLVYLTGGEGISRSKAVQSVLYSQITANGLGLFMGLGLLSLNSGEGSFPNHFHIILILIAVFIMIIWFPALFMRSSNFMLKRMKKETIEQSVSQKSYMIYLILQIINWLLMSLAFLFLISSYTNISLVKEPALMFILPLSWTIGLLAVFAPGGVGVREGAMSYWLSLFIPIQYALVLPWIYRLLNTMIEIILTVIFASAYKKPVKTGIANLNEQK